MNSPLGRACAIAGSLARLTRWLALLAVVAGLGLGAAVEVGGVSFGTLGPLSEFRTRATRWTPEGEGRLETSVITSLIFLSVTIVGTGIALALHLSNASLPDVLATDVHRADAFASCTWRALGAVGGQVATLGLLAAGLGTLRWGAADYSTFYTNVGMWSVGPMFVAASAVFNAHLAAFSRVSDGPVRAVLAARVAMAATVALYLPLVIPMDSTVVFTLRRASPFLDALVGTAAVWPACLRMARGGANPRMARRLCCGATSARHTVVVPQAKGGASEAAAATDGNDEATQRLLKKLDFANLAALLMFHSLLFVTYLAAGDLWEKAGLTFVAAVVRAYVFPLPYLTALGTACSGMRNDLVADLARSALEAKVQHQRAFMRYLFHEIRVPLNTIALVLDDQMPLRLDDGDGGDGDDAATTSDQHNAGAIGGHYVVEAEAAAALRAALEGATHLLSDVLTVEKIESGQFALEMNPFQPQQTLEPALVVFRAACRAKGVALQVETSVAGAAPMVADEHRLRQVMSNFLSNAVKFTPPGGTIVARLETHYRAATTTTGEAAQPAGVLGSASPVGGAAPPAAAVAGSSDQLWLRFSVVDSGAGFSSAERDLLFEPFSQLRASMHQKGSGSGLGLSISRTIVEAHGGSVGCSSQGTGLGATFWFEVPSVDVSGSSTSVGSQSDRLASLRLTSATVAVTEPGGGSGRIRSTSLHSPSSAARSRSVTDEPAQRSPLSSPLQGPRSQQYAAAAQQPSSPSAVRVRQHSLARDAAVNSGRGVQPIRPALDGLHVVLVDDSASVRRLMARMLTRLGAEHVDTFAGGVTALQAARQGARPPDVVITDLTMPEMDGCALAERLRRDGFAGIIIGATGHALEEDVRAMLGAGMDEVIVKPVGTDALVRAFQRASAKRAAPATKD